MKLMNLIPKELIEEGRKAAQVNYNVLLELKKLNQNLETLIAALNQAFKV